MMRATGKPPPCGTFCGPCGHSRFVDSEVSVPRGAQSPTAVTSEQGMGERVVVAVKRQLSLSQHM